jgi:restriction system protein
VGRIKNDSWIGVALESTWPTSAAMAALILALGFVAPLFVRDNPLLTMMLQGIKPFVLIAAGIFGLISLVKWVASHRAVSAPQSPKFAHESAARVASQNSSARTPATAVRSEPMINAIPIPSPISEWSLDLIQAIEWKRFEDLCQKFYEAKGIRSACTPLGPDGGIDIRLFQDDSGQATAIVQCKAWGDSYVGVKPIRELLGVMVHEKVVKAFFMTSGKYSDDAKAFAVPNRITLIDGKMLLELIKRLPEEVRQSLLAFATAGDYNIPSCPTCGRKMRFIAGKEGKRDFWGCPSFPKCRQRLWARRGSSNLPMAVYQ